MVSSLGASTPSSLYDSSKRAYRTWVRAEKDFFIDRIIIGHGTEEGQLGS